MKWLIPKIILTNVAASNLFGSQEVIHHMATTSHTKSIHFMPDMYQRIANIPLEHGIRHPYSRFHYEFLYKRFASVLPTYTDYCTFEENVAKVIRSYLLDTRDLSHMFVFEDEHWLWSDALFSYFSETERAEMERVLIKDLDIEPDLKQLPSVEKQVFLWDKYRHPFL